MKRLDEFAEKCLNKCRFHEWSRDWKHVGAYLHLEVSEYTEAIRGKRGDPTEEAADILFVLFSSLAQEGIPVTDVLGRLTSIVYGEEGDRQDRDERPTNTPKQRRSEMNIVTKYSLGDKVWSITRNRPKVWFRCEFCEGYEKQQAGLAPNTKVTGLDGSEKTCPSCHGRGGSNKYLELAWMVGEHLTIGQVRVKRTNTESEEEYMAVETGIGSGTVHYVRNLWPNKKEAHLECGRRNKEADDAH